MWLVICCLAGSDIADPGGSEADGEFEIPWSKLCNGCDASVATLTFYEKAHGMTARLWPLKRFWGPLCCWCQKMARVRYAHLSSPAVNDFLTKSANKSEFKNYNICYVSIRQEGRTQITAEMLENRLSVLLQCLSLLRADSFHHIMLLEDFVADNPDCNPKSVHIVQMYLCGEARLGVQLQISGVPAGKPLESSLTLDDRLRTASETDLKLLAELGAKALAIGTTEGATVVGTPAPSGSSAAGPAASPQTQLEQASSPMAAKTTPHDKAGRGKGRGRSARGKKAAGGRSIAKTQGRVKLC